MIAIIKGVEPAGLAELREEARQAGDTPEDAYQRLRNPLKKVVRASLLHEQGGLCAYCMRKIPPEGKEDASGSPLISSLPENSMITPPSGEGEIKLSCFSAVMPVRG